MTDFVESPNWIVLNVLKCAPKFLPINFHSSVDPLQCGRYTVAYFVCPFALVFFFFFLQLSLCLRNPLIPTSIINQSTTRVSALIYATSSIYLLHTAARLLLLRCHASRQVAIVPVFRCARTPHCCLPKHRGSPRGPSSRQPLSRRPKGKRVTRDGPSLRTVTAAPC